MQKYKWGSDPEFFGPQMYYRVRLMLGMLKHYGPARSVLDAGCGDGLLSLLLAKHGYLVEAVDISSVCIGYLQKKIKKLHLASTLYARRASVLSLPEANNSFDAVMSGEVLEHIKEDERAITEFYRVLKHGGICIITTPGKPELWHEIDDISGHIRRYTKEELQAKFEESGFIVIQCYYWGFPLNGLWHRIIFKPYILGKMAKRDNVTGSQSILAKLIKTNHIQRLAAVIFGIDKLFDWSNLGEFVLLVARKP